MTATTTRPFRPDYAVPPGQTMADLLRERGMTQTELARRLGVTLKHVNQVVKGGASISADLALGLEKVLGSTASFWVAREAHYQAAMARQEERARLGRSASWASHFPIGELRARGYLSEDASGPDLVSELLRFLGLARPDQWTEPHVAYRKSQKFRSDPRALSAWLRAGELEAEEIDCAPYDHDAFLDALDTVRGLTRLDPKQWQPRLVKVCAQAGVAVVIIDTFEGARANGATRWLAPGKALIQLSLRGRWEDIFWFTFFHEAGHVALHRKKHVFIELDGVQRDSSDGDDELVRLEREADRFAARTLIPQQYERRLSRLTLAEVPAFAQELGVAPAIVVGRLQHLGRIRFSQGNRMRRRFGFS
jgi:HTH-type transcriptional regulator/antitoxin HigA